MTDPKKFLKSLAKISGNEYANVASEGIPYADVTSFIDTGSYSLNALFSGSIYGGFPSNKITALAGESGVGKTFLALAVVKSFLEQNKKGVVIYFDTEAAVSTDMLVSRGIDPERVLPMAVETIQEFRTQAVRMIDEYMEAKEEDRIPMMFVVDSLGMLSTTKESDDISKGNDTRDMTRAQMIRGTFRVLTLKLGRANIPLILTNHTYTVTGAYVPTQEMSGGGGVKYAASTIAMISRKKERDADKNVIGNILTVKLAKSRHTKENASVHALLRYEDGLNRYYGLLELAVALGIVSKATRGYEFPDGSKPFEKDIIENPQKYFTDDVLKQIDEGCKKIFMYGSSFDFESMGDEEESDE